MDSLHSVIFVQKYAPESATRAARTRRKDAAGGAQTQQQPPVRCPLVESSRVKLALYDDRQPAEIDEYRLSGAEIENVSDKRRLTTFATDHYIDTGATSRDAGYVSSC